MNYVLKIDDIGYVRNRSKAVCSFYTTDLAKAKRFASQKKASEAAVRYTIMNPARTATVEKVL